MKKVNYNYAFVFYDVNEKRVQKVFKICKKYLTHFQYSVFRGEMTPSKLIQMKTELNKIINKEEDFICIIKLMNDNVFGEEILGKRESNAEDLILQVDIKESKHDQLLFAFFVKTTSVMINKNLKYKNNKYFKTKLLLLKNPILLKREFELFILYHMSQSDSIINIDSNIK